MRLFKIICLCLLTSTLFGKTKSDDAKKKPLAQNLMKSEYKRGYNSVSYGDSSIMKGFEIFQGWKIKYDDNADYATINYDDSKWDSTSIVKHLNEYPKIEKNRVGWFRKRFLIDSSMIGKPLILKTLLTGAAEIYLNGKLIHKIGKVSLDEKKAKTVYFNVAMPYSIYFKSGGEQVLAVRFLFTPHNEIADKFEIFPLNMRITKLEGFTEIQLVKENQKNLIDGICLGLFFMMAFIHFFFYYFFRSQQYNLSFSISMLLFGIYLSLGRGAIIYTDFNNYVNIIIFSKTLFLIAHIFLLNAIYEYLQYPNRLLFWATVILFLTMNILIFMQVLDSAFNILTTALLITNYAFLIWKSIKNNTASGIVMRNAIFSFLIGIILSIILVIILGILDFNHSTKFDPRGFLTTVGIPFMIILFLAGPQLSVSGAISFSLAKEFVKTNISLSQKLEEIEKLSEEKQHILSTQNEYLEKQVNQRIAELNQSLENLKITQNQLIQSEKLASLGELTAGIAHEIQNPLNFVNNFSELSVELIEELKEERQKEKGGRDEELENELLADISQNLEKITHHGKRASSIVKGMLEHSRTSTGVKESTNINALADEYLRLSYHGLRAKNKGFNSDFRTDFDENLPKIKVVPQDIGRVFLNLINNAFYSVGQVSSLSPNFKPQVVISTKSIDNQIVISIKDNGTGMPEAVKAKIFQPFFTTKPAGQGTGLGLSLSYDIIKAHGGELKVESKEGEYTEFIIFLPK